MEYLDFELPIKETKPKKGFKNGKHVEPVKSPIKLHLL